MSAPLPQQGTVNPYVLGYQQRQFGAGDQTQNHPTIVFDALVQTNLTAAQKAAEAETPLTLAAKNAANPQPGII